MRIRPRSASSALARVGRSSTSAGSSGSSVQPAAAAAATLSSKGKTRGRGGGAPGGGIDDLPLVRPPDVSRPDLAISRFFAAHRPLLDIELLSPARARSQGSSSSSSGHRSSSGTISITSNANGSTTITTSSDAHPAGAPEGPASSSLGGAASTGSSEAHLIISSEDPTSTRTSSSTTGTHPSPAAAHPGIRRTSIILREDDIKDGSSFAAAASAAIQAAMSAARDAWHQQHHALGSDKLPEQDDEEEGEGHATAHLRSGNIERSIVIPTAVWRRKPKQPIDQEQFARLIDELSLFNREAEQDEAVKPATEEAHRTNELSPIQQRPRPSPTSSATIDLAAATPHHHRRRGRRPNSRASPSPPKTKKRHPSPRVLSAAIKLLAHDAYLTSRASAIARAIERGENPALARKLGVESELVILGEQAGPSVEWARGVALWLAEHGRAYLPPPPPSVPVSDGALGNGAGRKAAQRRSDGELFSSPAVPGPEVVISDADTFVNVSLMDAENALANGMSERDISLDGHGEDGQGGGEYGSEGHFLHADLPPADPNMLLSHALVQARLAESLQSAKVLSLLDAAIQKQVASSSSQDNNTTAESAPAAPASSIPHLTATASVPLDLASLNADVSDIRLPALQARIRDLAASREAAAAEVAKLAGPKLRAAMAAAAAAAAEFPVHRAGRGSRRTRRRRRAGASAAVSSTSTATAAAAVGVVRTGGNELELSLPPLQQLQLQQGVKLGAAERIIKQAEAGARAAGVEGDAQQKQQGTRPAAMGVVMGFLVGLGKKTATGTTATTTLQQQQRLRRARARKARLEVARARKSEME
ncbi:hypothetical protein OC842_004717 [Tilletia horrida]|uniref:Uncharacterized protein n=1 Tax=Tilletia horrida TaxID=155126 RepID=A0AAN6JJ19_9BASI|nr:hypothetical protein OC842_004717 [Tilletia horrida]